MALIKRIRSSSHLSLQFREMLGQEEVEYKPPKKQKKQIQDRNITSDKYRLFLSKYWDLENNIEKFTPLDLVYFFREKANENGVKYVIANMKRDIGILKRVLKSYTKQEICLMIEFLFCSNQDYLDIYSLQPTILASSWCNTIYRDSMLWLEDKYVPKKVINSRDKQILNREWKKESEDTSIKIGEW